jgi:replicative superfamily II helicase
MDMLQMMGRAGRFPFDKWGKKILGTRFKGKNILRTTSKIHLRKSSRKEDH